MQHWGGKDWEQGYSSTCNLFLSVLCVLYCADPETLSGVNRRIVPFLACGDLSGFDSDMTYPVKVHVISLWLLTSYILCS